MKIANLSRPKYAIASLLAFFFVLFLQTASVQALGLGLTEDAPIMGLNCGVTGATDGRDKCCTVPGEPSQTQATDENGKPLVQTGPDGQPVLDENGNQIPIYQQKQLVRAQFDMFGAGEPAEEEPKKSGLLNRLKSGVGSAMKISKVLNVTNPLGAITNLAVAAASGNFGEYAKDLVQIMFEASRPILNSFAQDQAESAMDQFTLNSRSGMDSTRSVDWQCDTNLGKGFTDKDTGVCTCKPLDERSLDPNNPQAYVDWNQWILARVRPERRNTVAQVLGASTSLNGQAQFATPQERADIVRACSEIMDDFDRRTCIRLGVAVAPEFFNTCTKIRDPEEQEQCKQCIVGGAQSEVDPTYGEAIAGMWTGVGCLPANVGDFISKAFLPWSIGIGGGVSMAVLMYAAYLYTTSRGNPDKLKKARDYMNSGLIGLLVIIFAVFLLQLLGLTILRIPFLFGGP